MRERLGTSLSEANKWAQNSDGAAIRGAIREIAFNTVKLLFALSYFLIALADIFVGRVETVVSRGRGTLVDRHDKKLRSHLDWDRPETSESANAALRR